jgi:hypothetical protein
MRLLLDTHVLLVTVAEGRRLVTTDESILSYAGVAGFDPLSE